MLTSIRKMARGWVAMTLVAILGVAFAIWGVNDVFRPPSSDALVRAKGFEVAAPEFEQEFERRLSEARARAEGQSLTRADAVAQGLHRDVLQGMTIRKALDQLALKLGLRASDAAVGEAIRKDEAFRNQITGAFDEDLYKSLLASIRLAPAAYERGVREDLGRQALAAALTGGLHAPTSFADFIIRFESERRTVAVAEIPRRILPPIADPTAEELDAFYKENEAALATPEYRALTLIRARTADFAAKVEVPEERVRELFTFRERDLAKPETRSFVQVIAPNQQAAADAAQRLQAGEEAEAVAAAIGGTANRFNDAARPSVPDEAIAAAAFALAAPGAVTAPTEGLVWSVAQLQSITPAVAPSFDELRETLRGELAAEEAQGLIADAVEAYEDAVAGGQSPEEAAKSAGLAVEAVAAVSAEGADPEGRPVPAFAGDQEALTTAFAADVGEVTDFAPAADEGFVAVRVDDVTPPGVRALETVRDELIAAWRDRALAQAFVATAQRVREAVAGGQDFAAAIGKERLPLVAASETITRQAAFEGPLAQLGAAIFGAAQGEVVWAAVPGGQAVLVAHVREITRDDPAADPALRTAAGAQARDMLSADLAATLQQAVVNAAEPRTNETLVNQYFGIETEDAEAAAGAAGR